MLVAGGGGITDGLASAELFDPATGIWTTNGALTDGRYYHTATLLANGKVLVAGGLSTNFTLLSSAELYDYTINPTTGTWMPTDSLANGRVHQTATLLPDGQVLVAGGAGAVGPPLPSELYNPATSTWTTTNALGRYDHTATLLPSGVVLAAGGTTDGIDPLSSVELYNPATGIWTNTGPMSFPRLGHTATLLPNGQVIAAGGGDNGLFATAELYNPATGIWTNTGSLNTARADHTATLLPNGKVLVAGGSGSSNNTLYALSSAELYDPITGIWTNTGAMTASRSEHTATLLFNGKILVAGGSDSSDPLDNSLSSAELYDPITGTWTNTGAMTVSRARHTAALLFDGKVLVAQGNAGTDPTAEIYDPATGTWTATAAMNTTHFLITETLLPNGKVLVVGGGPSGNAAELYDAGLGFNVASQPQVATVTSSLGLGGSLALSGSQFRGLSEGSGGNAQGSPGDHPLVQLRSMEGGQTVFLQTTNWSATNFNSTTVWGFPPGWALATVFVNGVPSTSAILNISVPVPTPTLLTGAQTMSDGSFQFGFTNNPGALFGVLATSDLTQPRTNWTLLGGAVEISPGQFRFNDPQATNNPQRFYIIRSP